MTDRAQVLSTEALKEAKAAIVEFSEAVAVAIASVDADIHRISHWLSHDRPAYWKREVRKREEAVAHAKAEIMRKQIIAAPDPASTVDERKALDRAKRRLDSAVQRASAVRKWAPQWDKQAMLYKGSSQALSDAIARDIPAAVARLNRMLLSLEAYTHIAPPQSDTNLPGLVTPGGAPDGGPAEVNDQGTARPGAGPGGGNP